VRDADDEEVRLFLTARRHLPKTVFDPERWERGPALWRKVITVLNRGGRFEPYEAAWTGEHVTAKYGKLINMYLEKVATTRHAMTGEFFLGVASYFPIRDLLGRELPDAAAFDLHLITHREIYHTKSRTVADYWLLDLLPENAVLMNPWDAARLGLEDGDQVKIVSATNPEGVWDLKNGRKVSMIGRVKIVQGIRPGVISFALGFGHWAVGASDVWIDGVRIPGDPRRARGVHANAAMRVDEYLKNTCLVDPIGGSVSFYDTRVRVVKVT